MIRTITIAALILIITASLSAQQGSRLSVTPEVGSLYAYAANNRLVGSFIPGVTGLGSIGGVLRMEVQDEGVIYLQVTRGIEGLVWDTLPVYFAEKGCTGKAWGHGSVKTVGDRLAFVAADGRLFLGTPGDLSSIDEDTLTRSRSIVHQDGKRACVDEQMNSFPLLHLREVANMEETFPQPFALEPGNRFRSVRVSDEEP